MKPRKVVARKANATGFSKLKPGLSSLYQEFVRQCGPFEFFVTLTFPWGTSARACCKYTSQYLKMHNKMIFGREYYEKSDFIQGFAFVEDHRNRDEKHVHLLIMPHARYDRFTLTQHQDIFVNSALKVRKPNGKRVFKKEYIDLRYYDNDGAVGYSTKQIWSPNDLSRMKTLDKSGLTDDLDDFGPHYR